MNTKNPLFLTLLLASSSLLLLGGCNGSSSSKKDSDTATISGSVYAAPVSGAQVSIKTAGGETVAGPVQSDSGGNYSIEIDKNRLSGALIVESAGGSFSDEATDLSVNAGSLTTHVPAGALSSGTTVSLTPGTTIIARLITAHRKTPQQAEEAFRNAFGYTPDSSVIPSASGGEEVRLRAGLRAAAFSQLNMDLSMTAEQQFELLAAIADDLADGTADGSNDDGTPVKIGSTGEQLPTDLRNRFARAMTGFFTSANNETGLTADQLGALPEGNLALTDKYKIERMPMMGPMKGKSVCTLTITNRSDATLATGLTISQMPVMHMAMHSHSTPVGGCTEQADSPGTYQCAVYYLMASRMNGTSSGYWDLKLDVGGEEIHFYPAVMMVMGGDTVKVDLLSQNDNIAGMGSGPEKRKYFLFKDGISGTTGNHTFNLFIATKESMMSYPAVSVGTVLKNEMGMDWTVNTMSIEVSTDQTNWIAASDNGGGRWSATGITGLTDGTQGTLYVRLTVNGEQKTDDGMAPDGTADNAEFKITPGGSSMSMGM